MKKFVKSTLLLMLASFICKIIAFVYKIYIIRLIGAEGIGLYEMVFPIYTLILVITTAGIPIAISRLISSELANNMRYRAKNYFYLSFFLLLFFGFIVTVSMIIFAPNIVHNIFSDQRVYWPFIISIPAIFIVSISSAFRGFFQGSQDMMAPSISQIVEQLVRFYIGIKLSLYLLGYGLEFAAAGLSFAMLIGEIAGLCTLIFFYNLKNTKIPTEEKSDFDILKSLTAILVFAFPITLTRITMSLSYSLEAIIIPKRLLSYGLELSEATKMFGQYNGMAFSLINLPSIITFSLTISIIPALSENIANNNFKEIKKIVSYAVQLTIFMAIPCLIIFHTFAQPIMSLLYKNSEAAIILRVLALGCPLFYLQQISNGIMQGVGKVGHLLRNTLISSTTFLLLAYFLINHYGILGACYASIIESAIIIILNFNSFSESINYKFQFYENIIVPAISGIAMFLLINILKNTLDLNVFKIVDLLSLIIIGGITYMIFFVNLNKNIMTILKDNFKV